MNEGQVNIGFVFINNGELSQETCQVCKFLVF